MNFDGDTKGNPRSMGEGMIIHYPLGSFIKGGSWFFGTKSNNEEKAANSTRKIENDKICE